MLPLCLLLLTGVYSARADVAPSPPAIPLQRNLRFVVRPTLLGLLPPPDPQNFGEAFVRLRAVQDGRIWLRYELKEQLERDPQSGEALQPGDPQPTGRAQQLTRIRRGDLSCAPDTAVQGFLPPMLWQDGSWAEASGLLWLGTETFSALKAGQEPAWGIPVPGPALPLASQIPELLAQRRAAAGLATDEPLRLRLIEAQASYRCRVNGAAVDLPALRAVDSMLLAEYWILDDPANPLLLKLSYLPLQETDPAATGGWAAMLNAGGGCAITQIDF